MPLTVVHLIRSSVPLRVFTPETYIGTGPDVTIENIPVPTHKLVDNKFSIRVPVGAKAAKSDFNPKPVVNEAEVVLYEATTEYPVASIPPDVPN